MSAPGFYGSGVANGEQILKLYKGKPRRVVFCNSLPGHYALDARQKGVLDVMKQAGVAAEGLDVGSEMTKVAQTFSRNTGLLHHVQDALLPCIKCIMSRQRVAENDAPRFPL